MPLKPSSWILSALRCRNATGLTTRLLLPVFLLGCSDSERSNTAPSPVAVEASGHLVVLDPGRAAVLRLDPVTWKRTIVSDLTVGRGPLLSSFGPLVARAVGVTPPPIALLLNDGITVEAMGNLIVADPSLDAILRIDARSGDRAIISR